MSTIVFLHAHPDDEAIFTGGTMYRLAEAGHRVVLVVATGGERGSSHTALAGGHTVAAVRARETLASAALLKVPRVEFLGYEDSGLPGDPANHWPGAFAAASIDEAAARLAAICQAEGAAALCGYDPGGIYRHPDHLQVHRVGARAAQLADLPTVYEATVDHEYLHFVDVHLVEGASQSLAERSRHSGASPQAPSRVGLPTAEITTVIDVRRCLDVKRAAMHAHASQIAATDVPLTPAQFAAVYGFEWFVRRGPAGPIEKAGLPWV
ncbi:MAG: PIG-L deacetylase family protein [Egibacteraceae bacterium]